MRSAVYITLCIMIAGCAPTRLYPQQYDYYQRNQYLERELLDLEELARRQVSDLQARIGSLQSENLRLLQEQESRSVTCLEQQRKNECLYKHNAAMMSCDILFRGEPNGVALQQKIRQCMVNKGFPDGQDSCT